MSANEKSLDERIAEEKRIFKERINNLQQLFEKDFGWTDDSVLQLCGWQPFFNRIKECLISVNDDYRALSNEAREFREYHWISLISNSREYYCLDDNKIFLDYDDTAWQYQDAPDDQQPEGSFKLSLISMEYKKKNTWEAKIRVTDTFGADVILENKNCINPRFQGGTWEVNGIPLNL